MTADCVRHVRTFFNRSDFYLMAAAPGTFALVPRDDMVADLRRDYVATSTMIFKAVPMCDEVMASITRLDSTVNSSLSVSEPTRSETRWI